ncbi:hypothetical protein Pmani_033639 [Petrolisthes manimaculis]|uniref:U8 snoRNA-decapping enzyme n=1 Tax=Petrolisthes manimaculis TaxID=1843537 RepID=A0AAE1NP03_9EUCA|nr:hypothetical protein Pmani_033639 [Petrolisthes manimaculis]
MAEVPINDGHNNLMTSRTQNYLPIPEIPRCLQQSTITKGLISYNEAQKLDRYGLAAHTCVWAPQPGASKFGELKAAVMMHLRFDGTFGFPGGLINFDEDVVEGLNREMNEEIGFGHIGCPVTWNDYYKTQVIHEKELVLHFFIKEVTLDQLQDLEKRTLLAPDFGKEVMGNVRVPLYTMENMYSGLPEFLNNRFIGTAKQDLLLALHHVKLLTETDIIEVMLKSQTLNLAPS